MRRGEIWLVDLDPAAGAEADKSRPAVIVSNNAANRRAQQLGRGVVTVIPVTSNTTRILAFQTLLPSDRTGLRAPSKAQAEQVRSVDVTRCTRRLGEVPSDLMTAVDDALRLHLGL
jgi:mRNA interferase MazF